MQPVRALQSTGKSKACFTWHYAFVKNSLKIINDKGLLPDTKLPNEFGWKKEYYIDYVLKLVSKRDEVGNRLRENMRRYVFEE